MERAGPEATNEISEHYERRYREEERLTRPQGRLEFLRTMEVLQRFLPTPPAVLIDVGGATGVHAIPLAEAGYEVHLMDPMPRHVELARLASDKASRPLASVNRGDAGTLTLDVESMDAVLMLGPLYQLTEPREEGRCVRLGACYELAGYFLPPRFHATRRPMTGSSMDS